MHSDEEFILLSIAHSVRLTLQSDRSPSPSMAESLLYILHSNGIREGVSADRNRFREVFSSRYGKVRIYKIQSVSQESKEWVEKNRVCDAPGSWFCPGQYPPALNDILDQKRDFAQLEDFNRGNKDDEYTKEYFDNLNKKEPIPEGKPKPKPAPKEMTPEIIEQINKKWENNDATTQMWKAISEGQMDLLKQFAEAQPAVLHIRSEDGRGPMWWAYEYGRDDMIKFMREKGVSEERKDKNGLTPPEVKK